MLEQYGTWNRLSRCSVHDLAAIPGIGFAKATQLVAAFEIGQRLAREKLSKQKIDSPELVNDLLGPEMRRLSKESLRVILLDTRYHLIRTEEVSVGSVNESIAHPRDVFRPAVVSSAYAVIVVHNHPSGDASPSQTDHSLTRRLAEAAELIANQAARSRHHRRTRQKAVPVISVSRKQAFLVNSKSEYRNSKTDE